MDYTPTTEEVRNIFSWNHDGAEVDAKIGFDRWLFEMQEDAWDRGYQAGVVDFAVEGTLNPYRQGEGSENSNSQPTAETHIYLERERIRANIIDRVQDLSSCNKNDNCQEFGALIASYIEEWIDGEEE